jgi:hypothetical protein
LRLRRQHTAGIYGRTSFSAMRVPPAGRVGKMCKRIMENKRLKQRWRVGGYSHNPHANLAVGLLANARGDNYDFAKI